MKRRTFLKKTAAAGAAALAPSLSTLVGCTAKAGPKGTFVGKGEHTYECIHGWGELPPHIQWETTHGVCIDAAGLVYIKHQGHGKTPMDTIAVFDPKGKFVRSFGKEYYPGGHGIDVRREGSEEFLYLSDIHNRQVVKTSLAGEVVWKKSFPAEAGVYQKLEEYRPTNVAFAPDGGFYVGDGYGSHYIHQYDKGGKWVRTWGGKGTEPGKMDTPHGLWLDDRPGREPSLVVADRANARLQYFTLDGKHRSFVQGLLYPAHFDIRGDVLLVPDLHARVSLFGRDNKVIAHLGDDPAWTEEVKKFEVRKDEKRWVPGKFVHPHDACFDAGGNIYVVEWVHTGRVTLLRKLT
ncbi:MAG: twin-arginine translocation signal domain-containing protein [Planctomycetes bacterium]|nr:twin-arginine translocation signal domain-containing protein [Planctomycetota bacterium]